MSKPPSLPVVTCVENTSNVGVSETGQPISRERLLDGAKEVCHIPEIGATSDVVLSPARTKTWLHQSHWILQWQIELIHCL